MTLKDSFWRCPSCKKLTLQIHTHFCSHHDGKIVRNPLIKQPLPKGKGAEIAPLVISDIEDRMKEGEQTYGERLRAFNGRSMIHDAYEEALDLAIYLRGEIEERANRE